MSDRELLLMAAKAAGVEVVGPVEKFIAQFEDRHKGGFIVRNERGGDSCWNPLTDDGDNRRLQVALNIDLYIRHEWAEAVGPMAKPVRVFYTEDTKGEGCRLAVLRVAAAIGESMK